MIRNPQDDLIKDDEELASASSTSCILEGCDTHLTPYRGPGSGVLCRKHQKLLREYGGPGRISRPHTFHRGYTCEACGKDADELLELQGVDIDALTPVEYHRVRRAIFVGDHQIRQADGGGDEEENIKTWCQTCNTIKTVLSEDFRPGNGRQITENSV